MPPRRDAHGDRGRGPEGEALEPEGAQEQGGGGGSERPARARDVERPLQHGELRAIQQKRPILGVRIHRQQRVPLREAPGAGPRAVRQHGRAQRGELGELPSVARARQRRH